VAHVEPVTFEAELWRFDTTGTAWHMITLPPEVAEVVKDAADTWKPGFGSVRVEVTIGATTWRTSVFPDSKRGTFLLPVKQAVRRAERFDDGDTVTVALTPLG
jgi:hypothetical protein